MASEPLNAELSSLSLLISFISLGVAIVSAIRAGRSTQLQQCLDLVRIFDDAFEAVALASDEKVRELKLIKAANILENMALFLNCGVVRGSAKETVENLLLDALAAYDLDRPSFVEIAQFRKRKQNVIAARKAAQIDEDFAPDAISMNISLTGKSPGSTG